MRNSWRHGWRHGWRRSAAVLAAAGTLVAGCGTSPTTPPATSTSPAPAPASPATPPAPPPPPAAGSRFADPEAAQLYGQLVVATEDTGTHYNRDDWGDWVTVDGCTTRETVLLEQSGGRAVAGQGCTPVCPAKSVEPCWVSPYDGAKHRHRDGLQIDHIVPVKEANRSRVLGTSPAGEPALGAGRPNVWTPEDKHGFYLDRENLVAVTSEVNGSRGDKDPGRWKPANQAVWCEIGKRYARVKVRHHLTVDQAEKDGLGQMLSTCPATTTTTGGTR